MPRPPIVVLTGRHRPHEQLLLAYGTVAGAVYLLSQAPEPASTAALMPSWIVTLMSAGLVVSGVVGLVGCYMLGERGLRLEQGGMLIGAGALVVYGAAAFAVAGSRAVLGGGVLLAWALANLWRAGQCHRDLREMRRAPR